MFSLLNLYLWIIQVHKQPRVLLATLAEWDDAKVIEKGPGSAGKCAQLREQNLKVLYSQGGWIERLAG